MSLPQWPSRLKKPINVLAFDFGTKRIGVAFGQSLTGTARAVAIVPANDGVPDWSQLETLVQEWEPDVFVVGLPYNMDDSENELFFRARMFGQRLEGRLHKPCYGMDERLSSFEARDQIVNRAGAGKSKHTDLKKEVDGLAAKLILESWLAGLPPLQAED